MNKELTEKQKLMLEALKKTAGNVTEACKKVGISRWTHYRWCDENDNYKKEWEAIQESLIDFAESMLMKKIKEGDTTSLIFFLKTKGKRRGYSERVEVEKKEVEEFESDKQIQIYLPQKDEKAE